MLLYYITDRRTCPEPVEARIGEALRAGVDAVQIREKDLDGAELLALVRKAVQARGAGPGRILVNGRLDVALAAGADGVHLPSGGPPPRSLARAASRELVFCVSCHSVDELRAAEDEGAAFAVFGPVFDTPSKRAYGPGQGIARLREACAAVRLPVLALGGVKLENARACLDAGAAGVAAISLFQGPAPLAEVVERLRALGGRV